MLLSIIYLKEDMQQLSEAVISFLQQLVKVKQ